MKKYKLSTLNIHEFIFAINNAAIEDQKVSNMIVAPYYRGYHWPEYVADFIYKGEKLGKYVSFICSDLPCEWPDEDVIVKTFIWFDNLPSQKLQLTCEISEFYSDKFKKIISDHIDLVKTIIS